MPPTIGTTLRTNTVGGLKTYSVVGLASSFNFVRNTSVAMTVIFGGENVPTIENLTKMVFTVKRAGVFDGPASLIAETSEFKTLEDGTIAAELKFAASSQDFDDALKVNATGEDDVASAVFQCAFSWHEGTEIFSTASMSVTVYNNVSRAGESPVPPGTEIVMSEIPADLAAQIADLSESKGAIFAAEQSAKGSAEQAQVSQQAAKSSETAAANSATAAQEVATAANFYADAAEQFATNAQQSAAAAALSVLTPATTENLGTVKLSAGTLNNGSNVGVNSSEQLCVPIARADSAGAVRLCTNTAQNTNECGWTGLTSKGELLVMKPALTGTTMRFGAVRIADNIDDTNAYACPTAEQVKSALSTKAGIEHTHPLLSEIKTPNYQAVQQEDGTWSITTFNESSWTDFDEFGNTRPPTAKVVADEISGLKRKIIELTIEIKKLQSTN